MIVSRFQRVELRFHWWFTFAALVAGVVPFAFNSVNNWFSNGFDRYLMVSAWGLLCRVLAVRFEKTSVGLFYLGFIPLMAWFLNSSGPISPGIAPTGLGRMFFGAGAVLMMGMIWGAWAALGTIVWSLLWLGWGAPQGLLVIGGIVLSILGAFTVVISRLIAELDAANTKLYQVQLDLERLVRTDPLTRLGNRRALEEDFPGLQSPVLFTIWDVDGLKRINDSRGHMAGDAYLLRFVDALRAASRSGDRLYRTGGDEFVGLHFGPDRERLPDAVALVVKVRAMFPSVSVGWASSQGQSLDSVSVKADLAMYQDKQDAYSGVRQA